MKVSGIYPVFTSADIEREVKGYESLGFKMNIICMRPSRSRSTSWRPRTAPASIC